MESSPPEQPLGYCYFNERGFKQYRKNMAAAAGKSEALHGKSSTTAAFAYIDLPAHKAAFEGNVEALEAIFVWKHEAGVPSYDKMSATPLHMAARNNRIDAIKWLLRYTTLSILEQAEHGETPVHIAAALGYHDSVKALLASTEKETKDSLCMIQDKSGYTCVLLAIQKQQNKVVKLLISELGPNSVNAINNTGITAAHVAASAGNVEALKIIFSKYRKLLSQPSADGTTPTYFAAQEGRLEALHYLHETAKCSLSVAAGDNLKPIHAAAQAGHTAVVKYIVANLGVDTMLDPVPDGGTPLHFAATSGKLKTVRWLVNNDMTGLLVSARDDSGDTPAHDAAGSGEVEVLKFLLENGADLMVANKNGSTPYSNALSSTNPAMADLVVTYSAHHQKPVVTLEIDGVVDEEEDDKESPQLTEDDEALPQTMGQEYATVNEIKESKRRSKSRAITKSIQNALRPLRRRMTSRDDLSSSREFAEMGFKPAHRSNPLSKFMQSSNSGAEKKESATPKTPPPTPATYSSENTQDLNEISELDGVYSSADQDVVGRKRRTRRTAAEREEEGEEEQEREEEDQPPPIPNELQQSSLSHLSISSSDTNTTGSKKTSPLVTEKWPQGFRLDDAIVVTEKDEAAGSKPAAPPKVTGDPPKATGDATKPVMSKWAPPKSTPPEKINPPKKKSLQSWLPTQQTVGSEEVVLPQEVEVEVIIEGNGDKETKNNENGKR